MTGRIATAEWADQTLVEKKYVCKAGDVWLGRSGSDRPVAIGYTDDRHVCVVSGSRGGKGATSIVNNLILWPGSLCVVDPKGENATITAARRGAGSQHCKGLGQSVQVLDPFKAAQIDDSLRSRFNPLDVLDPAKDETIDEAGRIADAVVVVHESNDPFWDESARSMVKGLILHVLTAPEYDGRRNLVTVRKLILRGDWESVEALRAAGETDIPPAHGLLWTGLANNSAFGGLVAGIGDSFTNMLVNSPKQFESVLQVANRNTEFIDSPAMQHCLEASDFQLAELKTRPGGLSVYLCLPQRFMSTHYRWLRMMIALTVTEMEKVRGRPATGYPVLMLLDEFAGLKRMEVIENAVAQIAGYGVKLFFVLQSLEQLKAVYKDNWETFLANAGLKVFFNLEDHFSREYVSKLIGETEQIREVRTASDSVSESESVSRSKTRSQSKTSGRSSSTGTSESEGTNSSVSSGKSWGVNDSESRSQNYTYAQGMIFRKYDNERIGDGRSQSSGQSKGWTEGQSHGVSHGTSKSRTDGTSESSTTGTSETEGTTRGTSQSRTAGTSETIQKRALITPDEIGQVFARIDDRAHAAYPGLALIVISGTRPMAVRRVNYYEDFRFMGLFDPSPDYPYAAPKELTVEGRTLGFSLAAFGLHLGKWSITPGQIAAAGDEGALVVTAKGEAAAPIRVPRDGMITAVAAGEGGDVPDGPLFSLLYYDDGAATGDPFADLRRFCEQVKFLIAKQDREKQEKGNQRRRRRAGTVALGVALAVIIVVAAVVNVAKRGASERAAEQARKDDAARAAKVEEDARMAAIYGSRTGKNSAAQPSGQSVTPDPIPAPASGPFMVGKIDVSHFAGLTAGDTPAKVAEIYGMREWDIAKDRAELFKNMFVVFEHGALRVVQIRGENAKEEAEAHVGMDPLLALFGRSETDVVALLGPPKTRETPQDGTTALYWGFSMPTEMKDKNPDLVSQILMLKFSEDSGCDEEIIHW